MSAFDEPSRKNVRRRGPYNRFSETGWYPDTPLSGIWLLAKEVWRRNRANHEASKDALRTFIHKD
jgi:hypothetical protein